MIYFTVNFSPKWRSVQVMKETMLAIGQQLELLNCFGKKLSMVLSSSLSSSLSHQGFTVFETFSTNYEIYSTNYEISSN